MTTAELAKVIDNKALLRTNELLVEVIIKDAKLSYGNTRYQVTPSSGEGLVWVDSSRVRLLEV
jgi:hypothetical protein